MTPLPLYDIPESAILSACIRYLHAIGCDVVRCNTGAMKKSYFRKRDQSHQEYYVRFGKPGMGDIIACSPKGRWIECEVKRRDGKQHDMQKRRQEEIEKRGGIYIIARSVEDLEACRGDILA